MPIETVAVVGVGLIGGSFSLALRAQGFRGKILGVSSERTIRAALEKGAVDAGAPLAEAVPQADLVYLAQPISRIIELLPEVRDKAKANALVTDAGSTKGQIVERARTLFREGPGFVGGHPMAGKEGRGVEIAEAGLFQGATYVLTPLDGELPDNDFVGDFLAWLRKIGSRVILQRAETHDEIVAWTSHLPQLISSGLAAAVSENLDEDFGLAVAGGGLRDMTRLAESPYEIWRDILATNETNLDRALEAYIEKLERFRRDLGGNLQQEFDRARVFRRKMQQSSTFR